MMKNVLLSSVVLMYVVGVVSAAPVTDYPAMIGVYTDMTTDNTWPTDAASYPNLEDWYVAGNGTGALWGDRTTSPILIDGDVLEGYTAPQLTMTVGGLDDTKIYDVYVVYWSKIDATNYFGIMASLAGNPLALWDDTNAANEFAPRELTGASVAGCQGLLGQVSGVTEVSVDIGGKGDNPLTRAWFEGVAIAEVPEPATMILLGLGGFISLRRRL